MPANLPPQYLEAERRYREARTPAEKTTCLEEMLRLIPKHKGTDHLQADLKARLAKLRKETARKGGPVRASLMVPREGAGQVVLVGPPNTGKSALVAALTKARPEVADYPFTTLKPTPGMMDFRDVRFQLVDLPPLSEEFNEPWLGDLIGRADLAWLVLSGRDPLTGLEQAEKILRARKFRLIPAGREPEGDLETGARGLPTLLVVTRVDEPETRENLDILVELSGGRLPLVAVSSLSREGFDDLGRATFAGLRIIRVYTKQPGKPPDRMSPFTLDQGATVADLAAKIHQDVAARMRQARVWGEGERESRLVAREHVLSDGDTVEIVL